MNLKLLVNKRKKMGLTQKMISDAMGYTRQCLQAKETGKCKFTFKDIQMLREILLLTNDEIVEIFL